MNIIKLKMDSDPDKLASLIEAEVAPRRAVFDSAEPLIVDLVVRENGVDFPVRLHVKEDQRRVVSLFNGAVDLARKNGREFQRSSWSSQINAHVINFADPTILQHPDMALGWGQGNRAHYYVESMSQIAAAISLALGIDREDRTRLYYGSSAGGHQAMAAAALDHGSLCVVNNPQVDWTRHFHESHIVRLLDVGFAGVTVEQLREELPHRADVTAYMDLVGNYPETHFWVNSAFEHDIVNQLNVFTAGMTRTNQRGVGNAHTIHLYSNSDQGHNPMFQTQTLAALDLAWESKILA